MLVFVMRTLTEAFPDAKTLLALEPEELGDVIHLELTHADGSGASHVLHDWVYGARQQSDRW